jgi:glucoamylase
VFAAAFAVVLAGPVRHALRGPRAPVLLTEGIAADPCVPRNVIAIRPGLAVAPCALASGDAAGRWLAAGTVPGTGPQAASMAAQALLDLRLSTQANGAVVAGWHGMWEYTWPRDSSWVAVAFAVTGHGADALQVLRFLRTVQLRDGRWAARYRLDGRGPVRDGRPVELDADGWVPWATWAWFRASGPGRPAVRRELAGLWPMIRSAAGAAERSLTPSGLPGPAIDYWEHGAQVTLGTAAPLLTGLRAAADLAGALGRRAAAKKWAAAARRLSTATTSAFGCYGFNRLPHDSSGPDASVTFLGPPFGPGSAALDRAVGRAARVLTLPDGGMLPGADWPGNRTAAWTAETAFFALSDASAGRHGTAAAILSWLAAHRTPLGALPEQVTAAGRPASVAPLAWTDAAVLLALTAQGRPLPTVPVPAGAPGTRVSPGPPAGRGTDGECALPALAVLGR